MKKRLVIFFLAAAMVLGGCENKNSKLYKKGIEALEQKDYVTSIAMLEGAVKAGDRLAESYRSLGIAYLKSQEYDKAKEAFKSSLSSMKHKDAEFSRDVMYYEAETCVQAGDLDGAIEICTTIQEEKVDADALFLRGRAYFLQKNYEQAKVDFDAAVETKESYQLCLDIYELYQESSMKADGDRYLEAAVKIEPKTTEDYYNIGCAYYYLEEQDEDGTVIYFGCPAEEGAGSKQFMARAGLFDGVDFIYTWHPSTHNAVEWVQSNAIIGANFHFKGRTSHAGASPHM